MKKASISLFSALALTLVTYTASLAQVTFSLHGTAASNNVKDVDKNMKWGGGAALKFFMGPNVSLGSGVKYINTEYNRTPSSTSNVTRYVGSLIPIQAMLDFYLTSGLIRPYVGVDAGLYLRRNDVFVTSNNTVTSSGKVSESNFGIAPKAGIAFAIGRLGLFAEYNYHLIFGNQDGTAKVGSLNNVSYDKPNKLSTVNLGVNFGIPSSKSN